MSLFKLDEYWLCISESCLPMRHHAHIVILSNKMQIVDNLGEIFNGLLLLFYCGREVNVLNEHHVFMVLHGVFIGGVVCISFFPSGHRILQFPIIQVLFYVTNGWV